MMSATLPTGHFASHFEKACGLKALPIIKVPGRAFPVSDWYLEDLIREGGMGDQLAMIVERSITNMAEDDQDSAKPAPTGAGAGQAANKAAKAAQHGRTKLWKSYATSIVCAVRYIQTALAGSDGSVIVFLPGVGEIERISTYLQEQSDFRDCVIVPLHGSQPPEKQSAAFRKYPGKRKVVLSTNVAETSITIPDACVVIDTGRVKEAGYDAERKVRQRVHEPRSPTASPNKRTTPCYALGAAFGPGPVHLFQLSRLLCHRLLWSTHRSQMNTLNETWISKASVSQRRGRAGRTREGICFHLYPRSVFETFQDYTEPEIRRCSLEAMCLQTIGFGISRPDKFLASMLDPPSPTQVQTALMSLLELGATRLIDSRGGGGDPTHQKVELTPLGQHLAAMPVDPPIGKLLVLSVILQYVTHRPLLAGLPGGESCARAPNGMGLDYRGLYPLHVLLLWQMCSIGCSGGRYFGE